ncbi:hypothetical protein DFP72DRAFT_813657 [Ephemerocybe angulata]|uniref:Uncharacterized protein n=1 Tax=Ephemerocybe angulata TaxID=980116 RepID=A0A8H6HWX0_9AGAR|nr:hypothetical protein DFP72DRAFT_813657 [Tulosesus angulatus]
MALQIIDSAKIEVWGRLKKLGEGDTMLASNVVKKSGEDGRDATFVRYELYVDRNARFPNRAPDLELQTFYGQLQYIFVLKFPTDPLPFVPPAIKIPAVIGVGSIQQCRIIRDHPLGLDIHYYKTLYPTPEIVDIASIQCLVARTRWEKEIAIFDRSGDLARANADFQE